MKKILFICHGNICRSPMAEFVMKDLVKKAGLASRFHIESAATSREEIGNPVYPPARRKLAEHGISCEGHAARRLTNQHLSNFKSRTLENTGIFSVFGASALPFSLIFSLTGENKGKFFYTAPTTLSSSLAEVRLASLVAWA